MSLDIEPGEFVAVTGPSGSGKSTFMHIAGCLDRPTSGEYDLDGRTSSKLSKDELADVRNQKIGFVFQGFNLLTRTTALDNVELPLLYHAQERRSRRPSATSGRWRRSTPSASAERYHHMPNQLSGGQQQRVAIARALINEPSILLADEPTGNLDTRTSIEVMGIFQRLNKERGITVLLITHEMDIAEYGTRLIRFRDGRVVADQPVLHRRNAADELAALPPPEPDQIVHRQPKRHQRQHRSERIRPMSIFMTLRIAFKALGRNKLRTALTMLGMIIGVAAVIAMVALGTGAQAMIEEQVKSTGTNLITISPGSFNMGGVRGGGGTSTRLTPEDARCAPRRCRRSSTSPRASSTRSQVIYGNQNWNTQRRGHERRPAARSGPGR